MMTAPGVYQLNYRRASPRELWRMSGLPRPLTFPTAILLKLLGKRGQRVWLPPSQTLADCAEEDLTEEARGHLAPVVQQMGRLGCRRGAFRRLARKLDPGIRDMGALRALHDDGRRIMVVIYFRYGTLGVTQVRLSGSAIAEDATGTAVLDHDYHFDPVLNRTICAGPVGVEGIDRRLQKEMAAVGKPLRRFATLEDVRAVLEERAERAYERLIERGLYERIPEDEERRMLAQSGPTGAHSADGGDAGSVATRSGP